MPTGGTFTIETSNVTLDHEYVKTLVGGVEPGAYVRWRIADTDAGIDAATQQKIFDSFLTTKEVGKGTGLGVHSHDIVQKGKSADRRQTTQALMLPMMIIEVKPGAKPANTVG